MLRRQVLFPALKKGAETVLRATLRNGHGDLPFFFDELNDALEAHDCARCSPVTMNKEEAGLSVAASVVSRQ